MKLIQSLENKLLDNFFAEAKNESISEQVKEWNALQKKMAVISAISKAITSRVGELETSFDSILEKLKNQRKEVDGVILEYAQVKGRKSVGYKEGVAKALELLTAKKKEEFEEFMKSVTHEAEMKTVLSIESPELGEFMDSLKGISGKELLDRAEEIGTEIEKLPNQVKKLREGVAKNIATVISNLAKNFALKFKSFFKASDAVDAAIENFKKAVKADPLMEEKESRKDDDSDEHDKDVKYSGHLKLDLKKGAFHKWLGIPEDQELTIKDINKGLRSDNKHVRKMALFAKNERKWDHEKEDKKKEVKEGLVSEGKTPLKPEELQAAIEFFTKLLGKPVSDKEELSSYAQFKTKKIGKTEIVECEVSFESPYSLGVDFYIKNPFILMSDSKGKYIEVYGDSSKKLIDNFKKEISKLIKEQQADIAQDEKNLEALNSLIL